MTLIPSGYADCSVEFRNSALTRSAFLTFGVQLAGGTNATLVASKVWDAIALDASPSLISYLDTEVSMVSVTARVGQESGEALVYQYTGNVTGGTSGATPPPNVAVLVHKRTARGGRRGRGRLYIPWWTAEGNIDEAGKITSVALANLQNGASSFLASLAALNVPMYVLHNNSTPGTKKPTTPGAPDAVDALAVDGLVATQKRRLGRK